MWCLCVTFGYFLVSTLCATSQRQSLQCERYVRNQGILAVKKKNALTNVPCSIHVFDASPRVLLHVFDASPRVLQQRSDFTVKIMTIRISIFEWNLRHRNSSCEYPVSESVKILDRPSSSDELSVSCVQKQIQGPALSHLDLFVERWDIAKKKK